MGLAASLDVSIAFGWGLKQAASFLPFAPAPKDQERHRTQAREGHRRFRNVIDVETHPASVRRGDNGVSIAVQAPQRITGHHWRNSGIRLSSQPRGLRSRPVAQRATFIIPYAN